MDDTYFEIASAILTLRLVKATPETYVARLIAAEVQAEAPIYHYGGDFLGEFLSALARDWRGWDGERTWSSLEGTLTLRASMSRTGQVLFAVAINERAGTWRVSGDIRVENGHLNAISERAEKFCKLLGAAT